MDLNEELELVAQHYNESIFDFESERLPKHSPVELAITARHLQKWIRDRATVADIGVGVGHYAELLAKRGCSIYLVDISQRLLDAACTRLREFNLYEQVREVYRASATELECLETSAFDAVLLLGPLYHLRSLEQRQRAVREVARVLKPSGLIFAAGINRLAYFRDLFLNTPQLASSRQEFHARLLKDGKVDPLHAPPLGFGHLTTVEEFRKLFEDEFSELILMGVESFTGVGQNLITDLPSIEVEAWLDLVEQTGSTPEGIGMSDHFLYIGQRKA